MFSSLSPQRLSSKVAVLQESALSAVEAAADAVIGEDDADDHHEDQNDLDNHDSDNENPQDWPKEMEGVFKTPPTL